VQWRVISFPRFYVAVTAVCNTLPIQLHSTSVSVSRQQSWAALKIRDGKEPSLLGFRSVRVLTKVRVRFEFFTSAENLGSVLIFSVLSSGIYEFGCLTVLNLTVPQ